VVVEQALAEWPDPLCGFLRIRATEYIGSWSAEGLKRLRADLTDEFIGRGLVDYFEAHPTVPLKKEGINALFQWAKPRDRLPAAKKLVLIVYRWHPKSDVFDRAIQELREPVLSPPARWFLGWCRNSLPEDAYTTSGLTARADHLLSAPPPSDLTARLREAWLGRVIHRLDHERRKASDPPETDDWEQVNSRVALAVAAYDDSEPSQQLEDKMRPLLWEPAEVLEWLWSFAGGAWVAGARLTALADDGPTPQAEALGYPIPYWSLPFYVGVEIDCPEVGAGRAELAAIVFQHEAGRQLLWDSGAFPPLVENAPDYPTSEAREKLKRPRTRIGTLSAWGAVEDAVESRDAKKLARLFVKHPKTFYLAVEEYLLNKVSAEWVAFSRRRHPPSVFVGIMPKVSGPSGALIPLIRGLLESVVGLRTIQDPAPPPTSDEKPPGLRSEDDDGDEDIDSGDANGTAPVPHREPMLRWLLDCLLRSRPDTGGE